MLSCTHPYYDAGRLFPRPRYDTCLADRAALARLVKERNRRDRREDVWHFLMGGPLFLFNLAVPTAILLFLLGFFTPEHWRWGINLWIAFGISVALS
jgi:hypothetical protein